MSSHWAGKATHAPTTEGATAGIARLSGRMPLKVRPGGLIVLLWLNRLPLGTEAGGALLRVLVLYVLSKVLLGHAEILVFELLYPSFEGSVLVPQLYQLRVHFIHGRYLRCNILQRPCSKLAILSVTLLHYILDLSRHQLIIIMSVIFKNSFYQL